LFDQSKLKRININTASVDDLKAHPYISWNLANSIVKLRSQIGQYNRIEDVKKSVLMTDELYEKLKRYLTVDP
jgi:DNA uptake protein ComE-like DNA-binding protein